MLTISEFLYIIAAGTNFALALVVLLNNHHKNANKLLALLSTLLGSWLVVSYISDIVSEHILFWNKLVFVGPIFIPIVFFLFIRTILGKEKKYNLLIFFYLAFGIGLSFVLFVSKLFVISTVTRFNNHGHVLGYNIVRGPVYYIFILYVISLLLIGLVLLMREYFLSKGSLKNQLRYIVLGTIASIVWALFFGILLINLTGSSQYGLYATLSGPIMVGFYSLAIIKHQFLDIRNVILRLVAYVISLMIIIVILSILAFSITGVIFGQQEVSPERSIYYIITATLIAISFSSLKRLVDRVTNHLFFQQNYLVDEALNNISSFATRSVNVHQIQVRTLEVIDETIRPQYAGFLMFNSENKLIQATNSGAYPTEALKLDGFFKELAKMRKKNILSDDIKHTARIKQYVDLGHIGLITRLSSSNKSIGFLVLGEKKNGNSYTNHDLQFLALAANDLALALQNALAFEEIQAFNTTLQFKVNKATEALKRTNQKLVALDDAKDEFISMASHQLRTPLTSVKGYLSMMLDGDLGKITSAQRRALKEAFDSSQRMVFLISDFLNVSRIRTGKFVLEPSSTNLNAIVNEEIGQLRDMAALRGQHILFNPKTTIPSVMLDPTKTRQVMMNMIDNAIFYTPKQGLIEIKLEKTAKEISFQVIDNGIGVPKDDQHRLFTKFFRASNARNARPDGTGLGLFMAQKIIAAQGGTLIFKSVEGKGSTFGFRFPLDKIGSKD